ncbi:ADP-ribosyltransferase [Sinanaerobacter sp. ZZT-01]|uniref:ADP-ribosyltransferase n=1 Tax=Sinanaerobacter sp. ZZT-01 TaxID=3111540 RepID=UPI002D7829B9|nr:ADP-ribosyltransferase [Sinanaerobacter sp. ZZT-01]WRR94162.1 ADP-ribosyltransferase [Sinanaerobacter sp. ZZT-01]
MKYKEFLTIEEASDWGEKIYKEWSSHYLNNTDIMGLLGRKTTSHMTAPIQYYLGYVHRNVNAYLRGTEQKKSLKISALIDFLIYLLLDAPRIPEDIIVYRIVPDYFISKMISDFNNGIPTCEEGFLSTSLVKNALLSSSEWKFKASHILRIRVPRNTVGIYATLIESRIDEQEMMLFPGGFIRPIGDPSTPTIFLHNLKRIFLYECELFYLDTLELI